MRLVGTLGLQYLSLCVCGGGVESCCCFLLVLIFGQIFGRYLEKYVQSRLNDSFICNTILKGV